MMRFSRTLAALALLIGSPAFALDSRLPAARLPPVLGDITVVGNGNISTGGTVKADGGILGNASTASSLAIPRTLSFTGDAAASLTFDGSANATGIFALSPTGVAAGTYGSGTAVPTVTVDAKGRVTGVSTTPITAGVSSVAGRSGAVTINSADISDATSAAAANTVVKRDGAGGLAGTSGSFTGPVTAGTINLSGSGSTGDVSGMSVTIPGSSVGLPLNQRLAGTVDIRDIGLGVVDTTGATAVDDIVSQWLTKAMATGKPAYAPCGTYAMATGLSLAMIGDLETALPRCAVFKGMASIAKPIVELKDNSPGGGHKFSLIFRGGTFDNALGVFVAAAQSNSGLSMTRLRKVLIDGVVFKGAPTYTAAQTTTDSGIEGADLQQVTITNSFFDGQGDVGIYLGGGAAANDNADDGYQCIVASNHFSNSQQALALKREGGGCIVTGNTMLKMYSGINALDANGLNGGRGFVISNNWAKYIETSFVTLRASNDNYVTNNFVEDFGFLPDGVTPSASARAIRVMGANGTKIRGNRIALRDWTQGARGSANHAGITVEDYTTTIGAASQTLTPDGLAYDQNDFGNIQIALQELSPTAGSSFGSSNTYANVGQRLVALNANSQYRFFDPLIGGERTIIGTTEVARIASVGVFSSRFRTFLNTVGAIKVDHLASQTVTWGSIAAGAYASDQTFAFTGAQLGDVIRVTPLSAAGQPSGLELTGVVLAADQVTLRAKNGGAATLNMATSYQYKITLLRTN